jgi:hypothetical protein
MSEQAALPTASPRRLRRGAAYELAERGEVIR